MFYNPAGYSYCAGVDEGGINGEAQLRAFAAACPNSKIVISGYSQGTDVVGNILGGGGGNFGAAPNNCLEATIAGIDYNSAPGNMSKLLTSNLSLMQY